MNKILVTGGAGYIGSVLVRLLLQKGYSVRVIDKLDFGGETILGLLHLENFEFIYGDIRNEDACINATRGVEAVVHLAAIVGDPACAAQPEIASETNFLGTKKLYCAAVKNNVKKFVFASTCSNYGKMTDGNGYVTEETELAPVSLYAELKVEAEKYLLGTSESICNPVCLRFATVYGLSPRIRFDLTVNEFTKELFLGRELVVFGEQFWRPYCHVQDLARSVILVVEADEKKVSRNVFNVGATPENYQKKMIVEEIQKLLPGSRIKYIKKDEDPRDYRVDFSKINNNLGFKITKTVPNGISELIDILGKKFIPTPDDKSYRNT